jgi:hypothetical protein
VPKNPFFNTKNTWDKLEKLSILSPEESGFIFPQLTKIEAFLIDFEPSAAKKNVPNLPCW